MVRNVRGTCALIWRRVLLAGLAIIVVMLSATRANAEPETKPGENDGRWEEMQRQAQAIKVFAEVSAGNRQRVTLLTEPLLRYSDSARDVRVGTLWAWGAQGRPVAVLEVEDYPKRPVATRWLNNLVSLSSGRADAQWASGGQWASSEAGFTLRPLPEAPVPAQKDAARLSQLRRLAQRFEAHEQAGTVRGGRLQLRLMPQPLHRYADPASGLHDGAIFCFAYGTNPEVLLILESRANGSSAPSWQYGLVRMSGGALFVDLDKHEVWTQSEANPPIASPTCTARFVAEGGS